MEDNIIATIIDICNRAIDGNIDLKEFYESWPNEANNDLFLEQVYEDVEYGIEHMPGFFLKDGVDLDQWVNTKPYLTIYLDSKLLIAGYTTDDLISYRKAVIENSQFKKEYVDKQIIQLLSQEP